MTIQRIQISNDSCPTISRNVRPSPITAYVIRVLQRRAVFLIRSVLNNRNIWIGPAMSSINPEPRKHSIRHYIWIRKWCHWSVLKTFLPRIRNKFIYLTGTRVDQPSEWRGGPRLPSTPAFTLQQLAPVALLQQVRTVALCLFGFSETPERFRSHPL